MGRQLVDWIAALLLLRALLVVLCMAAVRWVLARFAPARGDPANSRPRIRRRIARRRGAGRTMAPLDRSS